jgi:membrane-associated protease RseP (regulator of RpoE activity)
MVRNPISLAAACGLLSLAVLAGGVTLKAGAAPAPEPKKVEAPVAPPALPDLPFSIEEMLKHLPPGTDAADVNRMRANMEIMRAQMRKTLELQRQNGGEGFGLPFNPGFLPGRPDGARLGAAVEKPSETLAEQLELPKDQGLVVREVATDSAAAKAGLKAHDILLELDGKAVSNDPEEFRKALERIKPDATVDAVVLRKGKKETVKGLTLPEAKAVAPGFIAPPFFVPNFPAAPALPPIGFAAAGNGVMTTTFRTNDHFTTRHQEGSLIITVTGKVADGKATAQEISVQDGAESGKYDGTDKVPEKYRDKVKNLIEMSEKGSVHVEVKP